MDLTKTDKALREMTELLDDWDDGGGKAISRALETRVRIFLRMLEDSARKRSATITTPEVTPGPGESVDIHFKTPVREMLINVKDGVELASFYGENLDKTSTTKGVELLDSGFARHILAFMGTEPLIAY
jgi:hypothetical protein